MNKQIKNIIFDLGGVILNINPAITEKIFIDFGAVDFHQYFGHGFASSFFLDYEIGAISDLEFIAALKDLAKIDLPDQIIVDAWNALLLDFPPERIELLRSLKNKYSLYLFSNTNALHHVCFHNMFRRDFGGESMDDLFKKAYYSQVMHMRKPDKASFEFIIRENKLDPSETLFVDDALINIEGAKSAGLIAHYLAPGTTILDLDI